MQIKGKRSTNTAKSTAIAVAIALIIIICVYATTSAIVYAGKNPITVIGICSLAALIVSGVLSGFILTRCRTVFGPSVCAISAVVLTLLYLISALILTGGLGGMHILNTVCYLGATALGMLMGKGGTRRRHRPR